MYSYDGNIAFSADFTKHNNQKKKKMPVRVDIIIW